MIQFEQTLRPFIITFKQCTNAVQLVKQKWKKWDLKLCKLEKHTVFLKPTIKHRFNKFSTYNWYKKHFSYGVGKFLICLLNPLTKNFHSIKDSFEAVDRICSIPTDLFDEGYRYFSFDVTLLFTNFPLNKI